MITEYDPKTEVILMIVDAKGQTICLQLTAQKLGITPLEAYKDLHGKFIPGQVYKLTETIDNIQPGYFIYERKDKILLVFCRLGMEKDECDLCETQETIKVHLDFGELFTAMEINVRKINE